MKVQSSISAIPRWVSRISGAALWARSPCWLSWSGPMLTRIAALAAVGILCASVGACASAPPAEPPPRADARNWRPPILFSTRTALVTPEAARLGDAATTGRTFAFVSKDTPAVAAALAKQMAASGLAVVEPGTPGAVEVVVHLRAWMMPPGMHGRTRADVELSATVERILAAAPQGADSPAPSQPGQTANVNLPLGGWKTPIGETGVSVGLAGFLLSNLASVSGVERRFNAMFGADATGTICLGGERKCVRSKGPQQDFELSGTYVVDGQTRTVTSRLLMIQREANVIQPLAYAIADWRDAALGRVVPNCQYWDKGERTPSCEPVENMIPLKDLR